MGAKILRLGSPRVPCPGCRGTGRKELTGVYAETFALLRGRRREITGAELARMVHCKPTAMNNRLAALERLELATSRRCGRLRLYRAVEC